jgi:hypothetical protein
MIALDTDQRKVPSRRHWDIFKEDSQGRLLMEPEEFIAKWDIDHAALAKLTGCSTSTVRGWFTAGRSHRNPKPWHKAQLAYWDKRWNSI